MMKKVSVLIYALFLLGILASGFVLGGVARTQADSCRVALTAAGTQTIFQFGYELSDYTLQPTDKVVLMTAGPTVGQNYQETDITGKTFTQPKPTTDYHYQVDVRDNTGASLCTSLPAVYNHDADTFTGGEAKGAEEEPAVEETPINPTGTGIWSDFGQARNVGDYVSLVLRWAIPVLGVLAFLMIIYAGYMYMTSQGNPETINKAKEIIIGVIAGIILLFTIEILLKNVIGIKGL